MLFNIREIEVYPKGGDTLSLHEDEFVIAAEYRSANRVVATVANPIEIDEDRCCAIKNDGEQCGRERPEGAEVPWFCHHHK